MTAMTGVRRLRDVRLTDAPEVGGKAAGIGELFAAGGRVPDGVVVLPSAGADLTADERRGLLTAAVHDLGGGPFAVRSSKTRSPLKIMPKQASRRYCRRVTTGSSFILPLARRVLRTV